MPLFVCDACGCVENTATSDFWIQARQGLPDRRCSKSRTGTWHDVFPQPPQCHPLSRRPPPQLPNGTPGAALRGRRRGQDKNYTASYWALRRRARALRRGTSAASRLASTLSIRSAPIMPMAPG